MNSHEQRSRDSRRNDIETWILEARAGSQEALGFLVEACRKYLLHIANSQLSASLRQKVGGSDLVQQTMLEACRDFAIFNGTREEELLAWLRRILLNNLSNIHRDFENTAKRDLSREVPLQFTAKTKNSLISEDDSNSEAMERREKLAAAKKKLSPLMFEAVRLRNEEGLSFAEVAKRMDRSTDAVSKLWARAVKILQAEMDK